MTSNCQNKNPFHPKKLGRKGLLSVVPPTLNIVRHSTFLITLETAPSLARTVDKVGSLVFLAQCLAAEGHRSLFKQLLITGLRSFSHHKVFQLLSKECTTSICLSR